MYYIFTCDELDVIKEDRGFSLKECTILSDDILGKSFINLKSDSCGLLLKEAQLKNLKIPFTVNLINDNSSILGTDVLLHFYELKYNKELKLFFISKKRWFNEYFNYFDFSNYENENLLKFLRTSLSFNSNTLNNKYNSNIKEFYLNKIIELKDPIALVSLCRNTQTDMFEILNSLKDSLEANDYCNLVSSIIKFTSSNMYKMDCFESNLTLELIKNTIFKNNSIDREIIKSMFNTDYLFTIKNISKFLKDIFIEEQELYEDELKEAMKKSKKQSSAKKKKNSESTFKLGYDTSKFYITEFINVSIDLKDDINYDDSELDYFNHLLSCIIVDIEKKYEIKEEDEKPKKSSRKSKKATEKKH